MSRSIHVWRKAKLSSTYKNYLIKNKNTKDIFQKKENIRKSFLFNIYSYPPFQELEQVKKFELFKSGEIWWDYSCIQVRPVKPLLKVQSLLKEIDLRRGSSVDLNDSAAFWDPFKIALVSSNAVIGGGVERVEKDLVDEFAYGVERGFGFSKGDIDLDRVKIAKSRLSKEDDVNDGLLHAATLKYVKSTIDDLLTIDMIVQFGSLVCKDSDSRFAKGLMPSQFRTTPIRVPGSSIVRPYPQEVSICINRVLQSYRKNLSDGILHPVISIIDFVHNFLLVHPFSDGNGRIARLLLCRELYQQGYSGCLIKIEDREEYFNRLEEAFYLFEYEALYQFICKNILSTITNTQNE